MIQRDLAVRDAVSKNEVAVNGQIFQGHVSAANEKTPFVVLLVCARSCDVSFDDVVKDLRELSSCNGVLRSEAVGTAVDVTRTDHGLDVRQRPVGNLAAVRKFGEIRFAVPFQIELQRSCHHGHGFLSGDGRVRSHGCTAAAIVGTHLDGQSYVVVVPLGFGYVLILADVCNFVAAEGAVDDGRHLCAGQIAVRVDNAVSLAVEQSVVHSSRDGFSIPSRLVKVFEIRCLPVCCGCGHGQREAGGNGENECEDSFIFQVEFLQS